MTFSAASQVRGPPEAELCDRIGEARDAQLSSKSRKTCGLIGQLGAFSPGLKPGHCKIKRSRGFENPLPRTKSPGLAQFDESPGLPNSEFFRNLFSRALIQS